MRAELAVPGDFASATLAEARAAAARPLPVLTDATDIAFVTIDPAGSRDLDQAVHLTRDGAGYVVHYAIADVAWFVAPDGAVDDEARLRGETLYFPDARVPLHPAVLSEGAASLLPGATRPAVLWRVGLDTKGNARHVDVTRALVRSRAQLDYEGVQRRLDAGTAPTSIELLPEIGRKRLDLARSRHAIDLGLPQQEVEAEGTGYRLAVRRPLPVELFNAEISLLTGMCAAQLMLAHGIGVLRTLPEPDDAAVRTLRRAAIALGISWPERAHAGDVLATLDRGNPHHVALLEHATTLLRGAGYTAFDGAAPALRVHAGIGASYAHVTAPLRRLVDRYGSEICLALHAGAPVPDWVRLRLPQLPGADARRRAPRARDRSRGDRRDRGLAACAAGRVSRSPRSSSTRTIAALRSCSTTHRCARGAPARPCTPVTVSSSNSSAPTWPGAASASVRPTPLLGESSQWYSCSVVG